MTHDLTGKELWIEIDEDKSATRFSPRKGVVEHVFDDPPEAQSVIVRLMPPTIRFLPYPHRMARVVLRYRSKEKENLEMTFEMGSSYAEVLELKNQKAVEKNVLSKNDIRHLGAAIVHPWPKPSYA